MSIHIYDTFDGAAGDLLAHVGDTGATWTRHPAYPDSPGNGTTWQLSGTGSAYSPVNNYVYAMYLASGLPVDPLSYDIHMTYQVKSFGYSVGYGIVFECNDTTDNYLVLHYSADNKRWELKRHYPGGGYDIGNSPYAYDPPLDVDREIRVERRTDGGNTLINVYIDGVMRITGLDNPNTGGSRVGLEAFGIEGATATNGFQVKALGAGSAGFTMPVPPEEPIYEVSGPISGAPDFDSSPFTVSLLAGQNPGTIAITPHTAGVAGTFTPSSVTLADADRTKTFLFHPTAGGTATLSFTNGSGLVNIPDRTYLSAYAGPEREAFWAGNLSADPTVSGPYVAPPAPYPGGGGYDLEQDDHYDPLDCWYKAQDYAVRKGLTPSDYSAQIEAAKIRFRDRGVMAKNDEYRQINNFYGALPHHTTLWGLARHFYETSDPDDVTAANMLIGHADTINEASVREFSEAVGVQREMAFSLGAMVSRAVMGIGEHAGMEVQCDIVLGHVAQWVEPRATRRYGTWLKPWMGGISARALISYWDRYRNSAVPAKAAMAARIPAALKSLANYIYSSECWLAGQGAAGYGCIKYRDLAETDPLFAPILNLPVTAVGSDPRRVFRGPASLSTQDGHYTNAALIIGGDGTAENTGGSTNLIVDYVGATRELTINANWPVPFDVTTAMTFGIRPHQYEGGVLDGAAPDLNPMVFGLFAWCYWHERRIAGNFEASKPFRNMAHDCFNGSSQMWATSYKRKVWNQSLFGAPEGLMYLERGDNEWPDATGYTLRGPATGPAGSVGVKSGAFRLAIPYGRKTTEPEIITPVSSTGAGDFTVPDPILTSDQRFAMFAYTPDASEDDSVVTMSAVGDNLAADTTQPLAVGDVTPTPPVDETIPLGQPLAFIRGGRLHLIFPMTNG